MWRSYSAIERELREIRLKCVNGSGSGASSHTTEPGETMKTDVVNVLKRLAALTNPT